MSGHGESVTDEAAMSRALELAERGWGQVQPNPLVGAVIVRDGVIVAEGFHAKYGDRHAEAVALAAAGARAKGATLFLTLEPCNHLGKQPPCVDAILAAGIARVVVALADPNPIATGGAARLRDSGVTVEMGLMADAAARLNARFVHRFASPSRPFTAVKLAVSLDGCLADAGGHSRWLSGPEARAFVHWLRAGFGAIGVGGHSLVADDARLTVRGDVVPATPPVRVVFDRSGSVPLDQGIFTDAGSVPVWMVVSTETADSVVAGFESRGAKVVAADTLAEAMATLAIRGVDSLLVEGGGRLAGALLAAGLLDRVYQVQSPVWLGDGRPAWAELGAPALSDAIRWRCVERRPLGEDTLLVLER
jgi:diaminohydroxyphosphoribosylaminopyrimidine deaminase/5-amino-6-(5-phosphoribosylamino)uracil reductase